MYRFEIFLSIISDDIDPIFTSLIVGIVIALYYVYHFDPISFLAGGTSSFISILYHYYQEQDSLI